MIRLHLVGTERGPDLDQPRMMLADGLVLQPAGVGIGDEDIDYLIGKLNQLAA